jgi:hypothetical protein
MSAVPSSPHALADLPGRHAAANGSNTADYLVTWYDGTVLT